MTSNVQINPEEELARAFPEYADKIHSLIARDEEFREIADDWFLCKQTLKSFVKPLGKKQLIREFTDTLQALEEELKMHLDSACLGDYAKKPDP